MTEPTNEQLWILIRGHKFPEDWEVGKQAQREGKPISPKTEVEWAYGWFKRLMAAGAPRAEVVPQSLLPGLLEAKRIVDSADTWEQVRRQLHGTIRNAQEDEAAPPTPFPTALAEGFGDPETLLNSRDWLTKAVVAKGAEVTGGGCGCGQADIDIKLEGCHFNVSIKPIVRSI